MSERQAYSIRIFLPGGDPDGIKTIEKSNWSGCGLVAPRSLFSEARQRKELARTGVYVLVGPAEVSGLPRIYVGEGDPIRPRLEQHASKKDFWTSLVAFTSKDENLNKAHVQYLEARLVEQATAAKRCEIDNNNVPQLPSLSEADAADAEGFLAEMMLCFPVLGLGFFTPASAEKVRRRDLFIKAKGVEARGFETPQGFLVRAGSRAVKTEVPSIHTYMADLRQALIANGVLKATGDAYVLSQDYVFTSPSTAAGVILGRSSNGRIEWKTKEGVPLKVFQEAEASS